MKSLLLVSFVLLGWWIGILVAETPPEPCCCQVLPLNDVGACLSTLGAGGITGLTSGAAGAVCDWNFKFSCSQSQTNACKVCYRAETDYKSPTTGQWIVAPKGVEAPHTKAGTCTWTTTLTLISTYTYVAPPPFPAKDPCPAGTTFRMSVEAAAWDPIVSADCFGQDYQEFGTRTWVR